MQQTEEGGVMDYVKLFRIDYRLLHWQTGVLWVQKLKANMILVAGDAIAADNMRKDLIELAAPKSVKTRVVSIADAVAFLNSDNVKKYNIELLVETTDDALALVRQVPYLRKLNAALMKTEPGKKLLTKYLAVSEQDIENFRVMLDMGVEIECYTVPTEKTVNIIKYL